MATGVTGVPGGLAATWADLNGDGFPELVTAAEWGEVSRRAGRPDAAADLPAFDFVVYERRQSPLEAA